MSKIDREKRTVELMIRIYCRRSEGNMTLCADCKELLDYAHARLERCPYGNDKHACKHCPKHCYRPEMRERIRRVMRFSGPRMIIYAPLSALRHLFNR